MTEFERTQLKTLLWKEWRQIRVVPGMGVAVIGCLLIIPTLTGDRPLRADYAAFALWVAWLIASLGAGVVGYGIEFNDHTQAYLATRPVPYRAVFMVKMALGLGSIWLVGLVAWASVAAFVAPTDLLLWNDRQPLTHLWVIGPMAYLTTQFYILLIRPMVPSLVLAVSAGLVTMGPASKAGLPLLIVLMVCLVFASYFLAKWRLRGSGW